MTERDVMSDGRMLQNTVIQGGYCIGCGACAACEPSPFRIAFDGAGRYQASLSDETDTRAAASSLAVCPFADDGPNEDKLAMDQYGCSCQHDRRIGYFAATYAGYVAEDAFRSNGSSGGMGTWMGVELFRRGVVDAVIHTKPRASAGTHTPLFAMGVSRSEEEIRRGAKSRYYPIELSNVLQEVRQTPGRYAIVGLPCFIKAVRRLALQEPIFRERIVFCIGLVCGHLKSARFADMLAWQMGISPGELATIDFRSKMANAPASEYGIAAWTQCDAGGAARVSRSSDLYGYNWGYGFFKCNACDYCDDVMAETADLCIGDAWLPQYVADSNGTNVIVVRNGVIGEIIDEAAAAGRLKLDRITVDAIVQSQDAGLRHRREGLAYRLYLKDQAGVWRPTKRVTASGQHLTERQKKIQECRLQLAAESHCAFQAAIQANRFEIFRQQMDPLVRQYARWYRRPLWRRAVSLGRRMLRRLAKRAFPS